MIHVIIGPPCSGKSTYVGEHSQDGDVIVDYDIIAQAFGQTAEHSTRIKPTDPNLAAFVARRAVIEWACEKADEVESWVIHTNPLQKDMEAYAACNSEIVTLDTDMQTCIERAEADGRPDGTVDAIREWFSNREKGYEVDVKTKTVEVKADENGRITGYAATFIREPDSYGDVIAKGAFAESIEAIKAENRVLPFLWNHEGGDLDAYIGTVDELSEDEHGLLFSASFDATEKAQRARELSADGRLAKFSFAYTVLDEGEVELEDGRKANELRKLNIHEVSLVLYPANPDTSVVDVKDVPEPDVKAGRRNSAKDEGDLERIAELAGSIQTIVNGLLGEETPAPDEQQDEDEADGEEAKSEELDTANDEEPTQKSADVDELLEKARKLLEERD